MYQPMMDNNEISKLKVIKNLILTASIISIVGFLFLIFYYTSVMSTLATAPYVTSSSDQLTLVTAGAAVLYFALGVIA